MIYDPPTPVERVMARKRWIRFVVVLVVVLAALYYLIFVNQYVVAYHDDIDHFKYGSIGSEPVNGIPILVFKALAVMYRDELGPTGYRRFGLLYETGESELPIGMSTCRTTAASAASSPDSTALIGRGGTEISSCDSSWPAIRWSSRTPATIGRIARFVYVARSIVKPAASRRRRRSRRP